MGSPAMNLLFWNLEKNNVTRYICDCIKEHDVDIAAFAEHGGVDFTALGEELGEEYQTQIGVGGCDKIRVVAKRGIEVIVRNEQSRYIVFQVSVDGIAYVICCLHMKDRGNSGAFVRARDGETIVNSVENIAKDAKCANLVYIGDFNANPYDYEMLSPYSFNAVLFKDIIDKSGTCRHDGKIYKRLYNPVLNYICEDSRMYGSYYYDSGENAGPIWNCFDMVLVSKPLSNKITSLSYPRTIGGKSLMACVRPKPCISDHLPLLVAIE